jgi:hypothetical protein
MNALLPGTGSNERIIMGIAAVGLLWKFERQKRRGQILMAPYLK